GLDTRLETNDVSEVPLKPLRQGDEGIDGPLAAQRCEIVEIPAEMWRQHARTPKRLQILREPVFVRERKPFGARLEEKIEGVIDGELRDEIDVDPELGYCARKNEPREIIALRILLPVEEVPGRRDATGIRQDWRAAVWRRPQANHLRRERDAPIV